MTDRIETLKALQSRIRESTGSDRELDWDIVNAFATIEWADRIGAPLLTTDPDGLGACVALMREVLPGYTRDVHERRTTEGFGITLYAPLGVIMAASGGEHALETHATLLAIIAAKIAELEAEVKEAAE